MYVKAVIVENFRMLLNTTISLDKNMTVLVGRNNTGKTSFIKLIKHISEGNKSLSYDDVPLSLRTEFKKYISEFINGKIGLEELRNNIPTASLRVTVDYKEDVIYGPLSNFILSLDDDANKAEVLIKYTLIWTEDKVKQHFENEKSIDDINLLKDFYKNGFKFDYYAVNPQNREFKIRVDFEKIKKLITIKSILAERELGEDDKARNDSLKKLINKIFSADKLCVLAENDDTIENLKSNVKEISNKLQSEVDLKFTGLLSSMRGFGYPNINDLSLGVHTELDIEDYVGNKAYLTYTDKSKQYDDLPGEYNGLGYRNLLKIEFQILDFIENMGNEYDNGVKVLLIEEPESHMHPQMQQHFVEYLDKFIKQIKNRCCIPETVHIQVVMTTHSAQIANSTEFKNIRYIKSKNQITKCLDLYDFYSHNEANAKFVHKYLDLSKCNVFFADKIILIEGATERILIPDMIKKCNKTLEHQYYTVMEVGGAHAHIFIPFMKFIDVPCLIITDIDAVKKNENGRWCSCLVSDGDQTSNATIKWWIDNVVKINNPNIQTIISLPDDKKIDDKLRIDYQVKENGYCGRSLEESIINVNRNKFNINSGTDELDFKNLNIKKTDFALDLVMEHSDYRIPKYIEQGLKWLGEQVIER